jgi:class 3 adenylate cyclase/tetratricopeptide (TPR) repeat protein
MLWAIAAMIGKFLVTIPSVIRSVRSSPFFIGAAECPGLRYKQSWPDDATESHLTLRGVTRLRRRLEPLGKHGRVMHPACMTKPGTFLFVSHVSEDRSAAFEIVGELESRGVRCWIAPRDVNPGRPFDDEIADAIDASKAVMLIFSDRCNESEYIRREVTVAGDSQKVIIPFRIENAQPKRGLRVRLSDLHRIDGFPSRQTAIDLAINAFRSPTGEFARAVAAQISREQTQPAIDKSGAERRQVTVLFATLAGSAAFSARLDPEDLHEILGAFHKCVAETVRCFDGSVAQYTGDGAFVYFGYPRAHEDDAERAVRAGLDLIAAVPALNARASLQIRVGIASGIVVVGGPASAGGTQGHGIFGETANLAARLADRAQSGEVLLSSAVHRALRDRLECVDAGEINLNGLAQPVHAWRLVSVRKTSAEDRAFVGRQSELRQFAAAMDACLEAHCGQTVYIRGEAGIGKTRFLEELQRSALANGFACHSGLVLDFGAGTERDAVRAVIHSILVPSGLNLTDAETTLARGRAAIDAGQVAADHAVFLYDLLNLPQSIELRALYDAMDPATRARGVQDTITEVAMGASKASPLLIVIEDMHWADESLLDRISALAEAASDSPVLLLLTSRIEGDPLARGWRPPGPMLTIDLAPLRRDEALALARNFFETTNAFVARCIERAAGNPLFLDQLLRDAEHRAESTVPDSVQSLVQARMDRLQAVDKRALQAASIFGQRFRLAGLRALLADPGYSPRVLVAQALIRPRADEFLFGHALIRDAVYATLLRGTRHELHQRAAAWFAERDLGLTAEHLDRAGDPRAAGAYLAAARAQAALYRNEPALALVKRGAALAREPADRFALACYRGDLLHDVGLMGDARAAYEEALRQVHDDADRSRALLGMAAVNRVTDRLEEALVDVQQAKSIATRLSLTAEAARAHFLHGNLLFPRGDIDGCLREHGRSLELARQAGSVELEAVALGGLGDAEYARGRMLSACDYFRRCVELSRQHGYGRIEVANLPMEAFTRWFAGDALAGLTAALAAIDAAKKVGHGRAQMIAHHAAYFTRHSLGEFAAAKENVGGALALARQLNARRFEGQALAFGAELSRLAGRRSEAMSAIAEALAISAETGMAFNGPMYYGILALIEQDRNRCHAALAEGEALLATNSLGHNHLLFRKDATEACLSLHEWNGAERHAAALEDFVRREPLPWSTFIIARARALAEYGRGGRDPSLMAELERLRSEGDRLGIQLPGVEAAFEPRADHCAVTSEA